MGEPRFPGTGVVGSGLGLALLLDCRLEAVRQEAPGVLTDLADSGQGDRRIDPEGEQLLFAVQPVGDRHSRAPLGCTQSCNPPPSVRGAR